MPDELTINELYDIYAALYPEADDALRLAALAAQGQIATEPVVTSNAHQLDFWQRAKAAGHKSADRCIATYTRYIETEE